MIDPSNPYEFLLNKRQKKMIQRDLTPLLEWAQSHSEILQHPEALRDVPTKAAILVVNQALRNLAIDPPFGAIFELGRAIDTLKERLGEQ